MFFFPMFHHTNFSFKFFLTNVTCIWKFWCNFFWIIHWIWCNHLFVAHNFLITVFTFNTAKLNPFPMVDFHVVVEIFFWFAPAVTHTAGKISFKLRDEIFVMFFSHIVIQLIFTTCKKQAVAAVVPSSRLLQQICIKMVSWYLGYRTFFKENQDFFKKLLVVLA